MMSTAGPIDFQALMERARQTEGSPELGALLESYRNYLYFLATSQISSRLGRRVSPSDVVQDTMLSAHRDFPAFRGDSSGQFAAWLRQILARNLFRAIERHLKAEKRDVRREVSLETVSNMLDGSSIAAAGLLVSKTASPSTLVSREEESCRVADLLIKLPEHYREVIVLRNFSGLRFEEVAQHMDRSPTAVRLLWLRAIKRLRELYEQESV